MTQQQIIRCVSWVAVSTEQQADDDKESLPQQRKLNREFIETLSRHYPQVEGIFVEELSVTGSRSIVQFSDAIETYPAYARLDEMIRKRSFDLLVCRNRSRLGREDSLIITIERLCEKHGIVIAARDSLPRSLDIRSIDEGQRIISMLQSHLASAEIREMVRRRDDGMRGRVENRKQFPAKVPYGWKIFYTPTGEPHILKDEEAAERLRTILLDWYVKRGISLRDIATKANELGWPSPSGQQWTLSAANDVVELAYRYAGIISYNRRSARGHPPLMVRGDHDAIINDEELKAVQDEYQRRTFTKVSQGRLFSGVVVCPSCDGYLRSNVTQYRRRSDGVILKCSRLQCDGNGCKLAGTIKEDVLYQSLRAAIEWLQNQADIEAILADIPAQQTDIIYSEMATLTKRIEEVKAGRERIKRSYFNMGVLSESEFAAEMETNAATLRYLNIELAELQSQLADMRSAENHRERIERVRNAGLDMLDMADDEPKMVNQWIKQNFRIYVKAGTPHARGGGIVIDKIDFFA